MDSHLRADNEGVRLSHSPRRSPQVTEALTSPARSVHPEMQGLDSINSQPDFGLRTADFFDDSSEAESGIGVPGPGDGTGLLGKRTSAFKKRRSGPPDQDPASRCEPKRVSLPPDEGYQRLANPAQAEHAPYADTPSTSFNGSVDELLPEHHSSPPHIPQQAHFRRTPRSSAHLERVEDRLSSVAPDRVLGAHAIAHEITLQALMRDEEALNRSLQSFAPLNTERRASMLPASLRFNDPRSPRNNTSFGTTPPSASSKKVHVVPPPIDTTGPRRSLPADIVRTPYPLTPERVHRKDFGRSPSSAVGSPLTVTESVLTLGIRRANPHSRTRVTSLVIPATNDYSTIRSTRDTEKERRYKSVDFDDAEFFRQLRLSYRELCGPWRFISARSLSRIAVSGPASKAADAGYGWLHQPRSPRALAYRGLSDTFSEEKILQHYRKPALGRTRYAYVHWAHRLAAAPPVHTPQGAGEEVERTVERDLVRKLEQPEGLEFVVSWSLRRILTAFVIVVIVSIAAALLWIFLGRTTVAGPMPHGGFRDAGDRVASGVLMGICILLLGLSGIAGWTGVSWLVM